jgi:sterol desaturase/sphingolipid hydroxylase (fatty acid hydroxylase superfamily)
MGMTESTSRGLRRLHGFELLFAVTAFPLVISATLAWALVLIRGGTDPALATGPPIAVAYLLLAISERLVPWHRSWLYSQGDLRTDIGLFFSNALMNAVATPLVIVGATALGAALAVRIGMGLWPSDWPIALQLALALVVAELVEYSFHRAMHEVPGMWRFHATHHSAPRLYWLNAARFHPIDLFLVGTLKLAPLVVLGAGAPILALVNVFSAVHGAFQHSNLPIRLGPLNWVFSMTELHRWHHSKTVEEANSNYGGNLIVWDILFGTRFLPTDREPPEDIGMEALPDFPMGFWANLAAPFRWRKLAAESSPSRAKGHQQA